MHTAEGKRAAGIRILGYGKNIIVLLLCVGITSLVCMVIAYLFDWGIPYRSWWQTLSVYLFSVTFVGLGIGLGTIWLRRPIYTAFIGASYGWLLGTLGAGIVFAATNLIPTEWNRYLLIGMQVGIGIGTGLIPALLSARRQPLN